MNNKKLYFPDDATFNVFRDNTQKNKIDLSSLSEESKEDIQGLFNTDFRKALKCHNNAQINLICPFNFQWCIL